jgi:hypothetical protein
VVESEISERSGKKPVKRDSYAGIRRSVQMLNSKVSKFSVYTSCETFFLGTTQFRTVNQLDRHS